MAEEALEDAVSPLLVQAANREAHMAQTSRAAISFFFIIWKSTFRMKINKKRWYEYRGSTEVFGTKILVLKYIGTRVTAESCGLPCGQKGSEGAFPGRAADPAAVGSGGTNPRFVSC